MPANRSASSYYYSLILITRAKSPITAWLKNARSVAGRDCPLSGSKWRDTLQPEPTQSKGRRTPKRNVYCRWCCSFHSRLQACLWRPYGFFRPAAIEPLIPGQPAGRPTVKNVNKSCPKSDSISEPPTRQAADIAGVGHATYAKAKTIMRSTS